MVFENIMLKRYFVSPSQPLEKLHRLACRPRSCCTSKLHLTTRLAVNKGDKSHGDSLFFWRTGGKLLSDTYSAVPLFLTLARAHAWSPCLFHCAPYLLRQPLPMPYPSAFNKCRCLPFAFASPGKIQKPAGSSFTDSVVWGRQCDVMLRLSHSHLALEEVDSSYVYQLSAWSVFPVLVVM